MGQFTEGHASITFKSEAAAEKACGEAINISNLYEQVEKLEGSANFEDVQQFKNHVEIQFNSGRYPNAEWQGDVIALCLEPYKDDIEEFHVSLSVPHTEAWIYQDDPEEMEDFFKAVKERVHK